MPALEHILHVAPLAAREHMEQELVSAVRSHAGQLQGRQQQAVHCCPALAHAWHQPVPAAGAPHQLQPQARRVAP